jgi:metallo-beta-lactamase family protein
MSLNVTASVTVVRASRLRRLDHAASDILLVVPNPSISLTFLGAAGTVTGSKHLLEVDGRRLLVDCGLFQGLKELRQRNWEPLPVDPSTIEAVILTHAHLDHCGYLPRLVSAGFRGRIFCTPGTKDLCSLVLPDSAHIQEEDAREANRGGFTKHSPALPLYTSNDAARTLTQLQPVGYDRPVPLLSQSGVRSRSDLDVATVEFINAGHLLGSAYARVRVAGKTILFGGDLGRYGRPVLPDPTPVADADVLLLESTYGDRLHEPDDNGARLAAIVNDSAARGGKLIIPSFAIGRVEEVLYWLKRLEEERRIPVLPVYLDSPMAIGALQFYSSRLNELDAELTPVSDTVVGQPRTPSPSSDTNLGHQAPTLVSDTNLRHRGLRRVSAFATTRLTTIASPQQSADLVASRQPSIVIASSGMATGGRVLRHLAATITSPKTTVMFVGYQAAGTRGRLLVDGAREIKLLGRVYPVAARVERIDSMSAHADYSESMRWLSGFTRAPSMTYLVHGDPIALAALAARITTEKQWPVHIAAHHERVEVG